VCYLLTEFLQRNTDKISGIVDIYPALNPLGIDSITRGFPGFDLDMNRIFPGSENKSLSDSAAFSIIEDIKGADFAIDIHASNIFLCELPQARINGNTAEQTLKNLGAAVHDKIVYKPAVTKISTTSAEVFAQKCGVCQNLSHVLITCLRINGIAARYVSGYVKGLKLSHAWTEAFYDGCWHAFDATENIFVTSGYIKIAHGRDASDCPLNRGIYYGNAVEKVEIEIEVK
jgi:hypothetical protein